MTKPWFTNYPENVAHNIDLTRYSSLMDLFQQATAKYQKQTAYSNFGAELTFEQVDELSRDFAAFLQNELGIVKNDRVALMCPNTLCFPIAMWGIIRVGGVQVNVNPMYTPRELQHQLNDAQVDTIIIFSPSTKMLAEIFPASTFKDTDERTELIDYVKSKMHNKSLHQAKELFGELGDYYKLEKIENGSNVMQLHVLKGEPKKIQYS